MEKRNRIPTAGAKRSSRRIILAIVIMVLIAAPILWFKLGRDKGEVSASSVAELEILVQSDPSYENLVALSAAYINTQVPSKGIEAAKRAIGLEPEKADAYNNLGVCYIMTGDYAQAILNTQKAVDLDGKVELYRNNLQWAVSEKAKFDNFLKTPEDARSVAQYIDYGLVYYNRANYAKAVEIWSMGLSRFPQDHFLLNNLGAANIQMGEPEKALTFLERAKALKPGDELTRNNLEWAKRELAQGVKR